MSNYVITWENDGIKYYGDSVNTPSVYTMTTTDQLGEAKAFEDLIHAEVERKLIIRFTKETYATVITVTDRELFEARLKGE